MNASAADSTRFQAGIYHDLDQALKTAGWSNGAAEAHGLLCGLACLGVRASQLGAKARLLQLSTSADIQLIEGMYGLIRRDLQADGFEFTLLLPAEAPPDNTLPDAAAARRMEAVAEWCVGFLQGFLHDGESRLDEASPPLREALDDIIRISQLHADARGGEESERQLVDIEEYLRLAAQMIFEELNPRAAANALN